MTPRPHTVSTHGTYDTVIHDDCGSACRINPLPFGYVGVLSHECPRHGGEDNAEPVKVRRRFLTLSGARRWQRSQFRRYEACFEDDQ